MQPEFTWLQHHYVGTLGANFTVRECGDVLRVFIWKQNGIDVLATIGMSKREQTLTSGAACPKKNPRSELIMISDVHFREESIRLLTDLSEYPFTHATHLHWFHYLPLGAPIVEDSKLTSVLFTMPCVGDRDFWTARNPQLQRVDFLQVVPISESEREYCKANGVEKLEAIFEAKELAMGDFLRGSVV